MPEKEKPSLFEGMEQVRKERESAKDSSDETPRVHPRRFYPRQKKQGKASDGSKGPLSLEEQVRQLMGAMSGQTPLEHARSLTRIRALLMARARERKHTSRFER